MAIFVAQMTTMRDWLMSGEASVQLITKQSSNTVSDINKSSKVLEDPKGSREFLDKILGLIVDSFDREVGVRCVCNRTHGTDVWHVERIAINQSVVHRE